MFPGSVGPGWFQEKNGSEDGEAGLSGRRKGDDACGKPEEADKLSVQSN